MNYRDLDPFLRRITDHEEQYRNGYSPNYESRVNAVPHTKIINGNEVLFFRLKDLMPPKDGLFLYYRKHSRFQRFPEHCHDGIELNYMYSGSCTQIINGKKYTIKQGQTLLLNSDTVHQIEPLSENDILLNLNIEKEYLTSNFFNRFSSESIVTRFFLDNLTEGVNHNDFILFHSEKSERLHTFICEFLCEWYDPSLVSIDIISSLLTIIISELINIYKKELVHHDDHYKNNTILVLLHYIEKNYQTSTLQSTADFFNLNPNYMSNLLKKHTGYSYRELVLHQKINTAKILLNNSNLSITEIANQIGYNNVTFFYDKFKKEVGCLPGEYRKQIR
ncbi:transcriptional regulator of rhamnose utilization, AraC family [Lachnospiraceae bacterium KM106-2]|nr:transcriptional regulator of rhamnose utilization, AraC family [Lachnospiraceae bacterium KM106-2]